MASILIAGDSNFHVVVEISFANRWWTPEEETARKIEKRFERTLRAEELAGDVEGLTSHNDDLLAVEQLLGNSAGQATQEVSLAVDDDLFERHFSQRSRMSEKFEDEGGGEIVGSRGIRNAPQIRRWTSWHRVNWVGWLSAVVVVGVKSTHTTKSDGSQAKGLSERSAAYCVWTSP